MSFASTVERTVRAAVVLAVLALTTSSLPAGAHDLLPQAEVVAELAGPQRKGTAVPPIAEASPSDPITYFQTLVDSGPSENRLNLLFIGDGYTEADATLYDNQVANHLNALMSRPVMERYAQHINVHVIRTVSTDSGIDYGTVDRDTALNASLTPSGCIAFGVLETPALIETALVGTGLSVDDIDIEVRLGNTAGTSGTVRGCALAGSYTTGPGNNTHWAFHELTHAGPNNGDEYIIVDFAAPLPGDDLYDPLFAKPNLSPTQYPGKWDVWLGFDDPLHAILSPIGYYQGAGYASGVYRPTERSVMRDSSWPAHVITRESWVSEIHEHVDLVEDSQVVQGTRTPHRIFLDLVDPDTTSVRWYVNGVESASTGTIFNVTAAALSGPVGTPVEVKAVIYDSVLDHANCSTADDVAGLCDRRLDWYRRHIDPVTGVALSPAEVTELSQVMTWEFEGTNVVSEVPELSAILSYDGFVLNPADWP